MNNVYVVTGGSGGIGLDCAKQFKDGTVIIADINEDALAQGKAELEALGIKTETAVCDVTNEEQVKAVADKAASLGNIKAVVHTAGISPSAKNVSLIMKIDLVGTENIIEGFYPVMGEGSSMVLIASMMGHVVPPNPAYDEIMTNCKSDDFMDKILPFLGDDPSNAYNFSKRGVMLLTKKWLGKFGEKLARINSVSPGVIETPMALQAAKDYPEQLKYMQSLTALKRNGQPEDISKAVKFLVSDEASFISGTDLLVDGGLITNLLALQAKKQG